MRGSGGWALALGLVALVLVSVAVGLHAGTAAARLDGAAGELAALRVEHGLAGALARARDHDLAPQARIIIDLRLPRVLLALLVGAALAIAGVAFQALLRNPLADPFILGVSGGAAAGAAAALLFGPAALLWLAPGLVVPVAAFAGALGAIALVYALSGGGVDTAGERLLLTGVVVNAFLSALILLMNHMAPPGRRVAVLNWLTGNLGAASPGAIELSVLLGIGLAGLLLFLALARDLDLLALGDESARSLGVAAGRVRLLLFLGGSLVTGVAVSLAGLIGFVGLIVPHALRLLLGPGHRRLVPAAFAGGGAFLVLADAGARTALAPEELPVGVLTALLGAPCFLWLLTGSRRRGALTDAP